MKYIDGILRTEIKNPFHETKVIEVIIKNGTVADISWKGFSKGSDIDFMCMYRKFHMGDQVNVDNVINILHMNRPFSSTVWIPKKTKFVKVDLHRDDTVTLFLEVYQQMMDEDIQNMFIDTLLNMEYTDIQFVVRTIEENYGIRVYIPSMHIDVSL